MAKGQGPRVTFRNSLGRFERASAKGVRVYSRSGKRLTGKARKRELRKAEHGRIRGRLLTGFPKGYTSPFKAFILPVSRARTPERAFALVEIESRRKYEGTSYRNWVPFAMGYMEPARARRLVVGDVEEAFKLSNLRGKNSLVRVFGFYMLKSEESRREALTPRRLRLIRWRAEHGNENRPKKRKRKS